LLCKAVSIIILIKWPVASHIEAELSKFCILCDPALGADGLFEVVPAEQGAYS